LAEK
jgi:hypothetical protein